MCGIAVCITSDKRVQATFSREALELLSHRGPDGHGQWQDEHVCLVHTRLSILDLTEAGSQPMVSVSGRYVITFNGEIYNHLQLRKQYLPLTQFKGHSDTETLLALFETMGEKMLACLVGMWAFAIWDIKERKLFVSRDRYGQKPLYYIKSSRGIFFASEIKPLLPLLNSRRLNATAAAEYLAVGNYGHLGVHTFFQDVYSFPPSNYAWVNFSTADFNTYAYWQLPEVHEREKISFTTETRDALSALLKEAVISQTISDVPIGMTLSGGIDSSVIAGILAKQSPAPIQVFTASNRGNRHDESPFARKVIVHWEREAKLQMHEVEMDSLSITQHLEKGIWVQEEPFGDPSILSHLQIMNKVKEYNIKVILGGQGADELFFGYDSINQALISNLLTTGSPITFMRAVRSMKVGATDMARIMWATIANSSYQQARRKSRMQRRSFINPGLLLHVDESLIHLANPSDFTDLWRESIRGVHLPHLMHYDDRNGMSLGIEGRMPFLDHRLIEFLGYIKPNEFVKGGVRKYLLKEAAKYYLPSEVYSRQDKIGFFAPIHEMIYKDIDFLFEQFQEVIFPFQLVDEKTLSEDLNFYKRGGINVERARRIWRVYSLSVWMNSFKVVV